MLGLHFHQFGKARDHRRARGLDRQGRGLRDFGCERNGGGAKLVLRDEQVGAPPAEGLLGFDASTSDDRAGSAAAAAFVDAVEASRFVGTNGVLILGGHRFMPTSKRSV